MGLFFFSFFNSNGIISQKRLVNWILY